MFQYNSRSKSSSQPQQQQQQRLQTWANKYQRIKSEFRLREQVKTQPQKTTRYDSSGHELPKRTLRLVTNNDDGGANFNPRQLLFDIMDATDKSSRRRTAALAQLHSFQIIDVDEQKQQQQQQFVTSTSMLQQQQTMGQVQPLFELSRPTTLLNMIIPYASSAIEYLAILSIVWSLPKLAALEFLNFTPETQQLFKKHNRLTMTFITKVVRIIRDGVKNEKPVWLQLHEVQATVIQLATQTQITGFSLYLVGQLTAGGLGIVGTAGVIATLVIVPGTTSMFVKNVVIDKIQLGAYEYLASDKAIKYRTNDTNDDNDQANQRNTEFAQRLLVLEENHTAWMRKQQSWVWQTLTNPTAIITSGKLGVAASWLYYSQDWHKTDSTLKQVLVGFTDDIVTTTLVSSSLTTIVSRLVMPFMFSAWDWIYIRTIPEEHRVSFYRHLVRYRLYRFVRAVKPALEASVDSFLQLYFNTRNVRTMLFGLPAPAAPSNESEPVARGPSAAPSNGIEPPQSDLLPPPTQMPTPRVAQLSWLSTHPEMRQMFHQLELIESRGVFNKHPDHVKWSQLYATDHTFTNTYNGVQVPADIQRQWADLLSRAGIPPTELPTNNTPVAVAAWLERWAVDNRVNKPIDLLLNVFGQLPNITDTLKPKVVDGNGRTLLNFNIQPTSPLSPVVNGFNTVVGTLNNVTNKITDQQDNHIFNVDVDAGVLTDVPNNKFIGKLMSAPPTPRVWLEPLLFTNVNNTQTLLENSPRELNDLILFTTNNVAAGLFTANITQNNIGKIEFNITNAAGDFVFAKAVEGVFHTIDNPTVPIAIVANTQPAADTNIIPFDTINSASNNWSFTGSFTVQSVKDVYNRLMSYNTTLEKYLGFNPEKLNQNNTTLVPLDFFTKTATTPTTTNLDDRSIPINVLEEQQQQQPTEQQQQQQPSSTPTPGWFNWAAYKFYDRLVKPSLQWLETRPEIDLQQFKNPPPPKPIVQPTSSINTNTSTWLPLEYFKLVSGTPKPTTPANTTRVTLLPPGFFDPPIDVDTGPFSFLPWINQTPDGSPTVPDPVPLPTTLANSSRITLLPEDYFGFYNLRQKVLDDELNHINEAAVSAAVATNNTNSLMSDAVNEFRKALQDAFIKQSTTPSDSKPTTTTTTATPAPVESTDGFTANSNIDIGNKNDNNNNNNPIIEQPRYNGGGSGGDNNNDDDNAVVDTSTVVDDENNIANNVARVFGDAVLDDTNAPPIEAQVNSFNATVKLVQDLSNILNPPQLQQQPPLQQQQQQQQQQQAPTTISSNNNIPELPNFNKIDDPMQLFEKAKECESRYTQPWSQSNGVVKDANGNVIAKDCLLQTPGKQILRNIFDLLVTSQNQALAGSGFFTTLVSNGLAAFAGVETGGADMVSIAAHLVAAPVLTDEMFDAVDKLPDNALSEIYEKTWGTVTGTQPKIRELNALLRAVYHSDHRNDQVYVFPSDILQLDMSEINELVRLSNNNYNNNNPSYDEFLKRALESKLASLVLFGSSGVSPLYDKRHELISILTTDLLDISASTLVAKTLAGWGAFTPWAIASKLSLVTDPKFGYTTLRTFGKGIVDIINDLTGANTIERLSQLSVDQLPQEKQVNLVNGLLQKIRDNSATTAPTRIEQTQQHIRRVLLTYYGINPTVKEIRYSDFGGPSSLLSREELDFLTQDINFKFDWNDWSTNYTPLQRDPLLFQQVQQQLLVPDETSRLKTMLQLLGSRHSNPTLAYEALETTLPSFDTRALLEQLLLIKKFGWDDTFSTLAKYSASPKYDLSVMHKFDSFLLDQRDIDSSVVPAKPAGLVTYWFEIVQAIRDPAERQTREKILLKYYGIDFQALGKLNKIKYSNVGGVSSNLNSDEIRMLLGPDLAKRFDVQDYFDNYNVLEREPAFMSVLKEIRQLPFVERQNIMQMRLLVPPHNWNDDVENVLMLEQLFDDEPKTRDLYISILTSFSYRASQFAGGVAASFFNNLLGLNE